MKPILQQPVFQLSGGTKAARKEFLAQVGAELDQRSLLHTVVDGAEDHRLHGLSILGKYYDLVFVDGDHDLAVQQIKIDCEDVENKNSFIFRSGEDITQQGLMDTLLAKLEELQAGVPVWACVLIGGKSSRMGQPKHLIRNLQGTTWLEQTVDILRPFVDGVVVSGSGELPEAIADIIRLPDIPGVYGPLTGILSAGRWLPGASWLLVACDMPHITSEAVAWLLSERPVGCWGRVPRLSGSEHCEPLFGWYDFRASHLFEEQLAGGNLRIGDTASHPKIDNPGIPESLCSAWQNLNSPDQLGSDHCRG